MKRTWIDGQVVAAKRAHPYSEEIAVSKLMRLEFLSDVRWVCWWCGRRPPARVGKAVAVDHIVPMTYFSPRVVMCAGCNWRRRGILPDAVQLGRLLWDDNVLRSLDAKQMRAWLAEQAKMVFGGYQQGISLLLAKVQGYDVVGAKKTKTNYVVYEKCEVSNRLCEKAGYV